MHTEMDMRRHAPELSSSSLLPFCSPSIPTNHPEDDDGDDDDDDAETKYIKAWRLLYRELQEKERGKGCKRKEKRTSI